MRSSASGRLPTRLILSYIFDWIMIIAIALVGYAFSTISPNKRPFALTDPSISFPHKKSEVISTATLAVASLILPAALIVLSCFLLSLPRSAKKNGIGIRKPVPRGKLRRGLWEWNAGWMGLGLALAVAFLVTNGVKNVVGKPRPDLLGRCDPDFSRAVASQVGGVGDAVAEGTALVSWTVCRDTTDLDDGFRSFPSGHSSFSFAGLTYLALFTCAKWGVGVPFLNYESWGSRRVSLREQGAAPPIYLMILPLFPMAVAMFVASTRYSDFRHFGWDIIAGSVLGIASALLGFRMYHLPISRGGGWAWVPRSPDRAFGRGMGSVGYVNDDFRNGRREDLESGPMNGGEASDVPLQQIKSSEGSHNTDLRDDMRGVGVGNKSSSSQQPPQEV